MIILFLNSCFQWTMVPSQTPCSTHSATHYLVDLTGLWQKRRFSKCHSFVLVRGRRKYGGQRGRPDCPFRFYRNRKEDTRRERFFSISPHKFLNLPPVLFVVVRFLPTTYYILLHLDTRSDLNLRSGIHKSVFYQFTFPQLHIERKLIEMSKGRP